MVIRFNQCFTDAFTIASKKSFLNTFFFVTPPTSIQNSAIFAPFTKAKSHRPFFALFPKNTDFFRPKKGPRTGLSHSLTHLTAIQFSDYAKSMAQITERIFNEAHSRCRSQKSIIFRSRTNGMHISFSSLPDG